MLFTEVHKRPVFRHLIQLPLLLHPIQTRGSPMEPHIIMDLNQKVPVEVIRSCVQPMLRQMLLRQRAFRRLPAPAR